MKSETKEALYSLLDLIDTISSLNFVSINLDKTNKIREEVLDIINNNTTSSSNKLENKKIEFVGILPTILLDKTKFPANKDILTFAEKCLKIEVKDYWRTRKREEVVGRIISEVATQNERELEYFIKAWDLFNKDDSDIKVKKKNKNSTNKDSFIDTWFNFFDNYKDENNE
jgi:putative cell wall-binding protein